MENLGELFAALAAARLEFVAFAKSKSATIKSDKGSYSYSYAELSDIIDATAPALARHGLVIIQEPELVTENGKQQVVISGCIAHKSGGIYPLKPLPMPVAGSTAQAIGSAISYARRYQLSAILNLAASDDDGQEAGKPAMAADVAFHQPQPEHATKAQLAELGEIGASCYGDEWPEQLPKLVESVTKGATSNVSELLSKEAAKLIDGIKKKMAMLNAEVAK